MRMQRGRRGVVAVCVATIAVCAAAGASFSAPAPSVAPGDWPSFGRTLDNNRYSPLTQITPANADQLGRAYTVDFLRVDPDTRRGQQSYPLAIGGTLFVTTNDANVFAIEGGTGKILWQRKPRNSGVFKNFGTVANRGLAYCGGKLFILQLDMRLIAMRPSDGQVVGELAIEQDVPNASVAYGYSETSAPICAGGKLIFGAAGSERGNRGFVMAYTTDLKPAWPTPFWTIPPDLQSWRRASRIVGGGPVWTPVTVDVTTNTVYFGTGSGTPVYFPSLRPGNNPRAASLIAVDLSTGKLKWWQQLIERDQWEYDVAQPPLVYNAKIGGQTRRIVSVATKEGVWYAFDARSGRPFHERVKVLDRVEHPPLKPGQPVTVFPGSIGGLNYSPAAYDPKTNFVFNAAAETAGILIQQKLTPTQKKRKFLLGDIFLGLENGNFGQYLPGWKDHGSISAINVSTGRRVWKVDTPEPERGGVSVTASGVGFAGGGDGVLRAFELRTGKILWTFQTGRQIAAGPTIFSAGGKQFVAITVGGTPTSSSGGLASQLQVFSLGGSKTESPKPPNLTAVATRGRERRGRRQSAARRGRPPSADLGPERGADAQPLEPEHVEPPRRQRSRDTWRTARERRRDRGRPIRAPTAHGRRRQVHRGSRHDAGSTPSGDRRGCRARHGRRSRAVGRRAGVVASGVGRDQRRLPAGRGPRLAGSRQHGPRPRAGGSRRRGTGAAGRPAVVPAHRHDQRRGGQAGNGRIPRLPYERPRLLDVLGAEQCARPVCLVLPGLGPQRSRPGRVLGSGRRRSFELHDRRAEPDLQAPQQRDARSEAARARAPRWRCRRPTPVPGAIYRGMLVGVSSGSRVVKPVSATWPDARGRFELVLPASVRGKTLRFWQSDFQSYQASPGVPGGRGRPRSLAGRAVRARAS